MLAEPYRQDSSYESGGGRFSIIPGFTSTYSTMQDSDDAVTSSLPGQWNSSSISLQKSVETGNIEVLQQSNVGSRYEESSDEHSMSSDDKPLQWRMVTKQDTYLSSPEMETLTDEEKLAQDGMQESHRRVEAEEDTPSGEDFVTKMIDATVDGIERHQEEESRVRFVDDNGITFRLETENGDRSGDHPNEVEEDGSIYDDDEEEEEEVVEPSPPSSVYHEPLQLDLLTLNFEEDTELQFLFTDDGLQQLNNGSTRKQEPIKYPIISSTGAPCSFSSSKRDVVNAFSDSGSSEDDHSQSYHPRSLFAGKGVYFSGPVRELAPVKQVKEVVKSKVDFRLPPTHAYRGDLQRDEISQVDWHADRKAVHNASKHAVKPPALQWKMADEQFSCEMPHFDMSAFEEKKEKSLPQQPRPVLKSQFSSSLPPSEKLPEKPIHNEFSVTILNSVSKGSGVNEDVPRSLSAANHQIELIPKAQLTSEPSAASLPVVVAHPQQIPQTSSSHVNKSPSPLAQLSVPTKKKEEAEKPPRPPHPLSQSYSASEQEEERTLDHPRSSYIAKQLDRFKASPSPQPQSHTPQPSHSAHRADRETQPSTTLVQPNLAEQFNREAMHLSNDSPRNRLNSPSPSDKPLSSHSRIARHLKEQDIEFIEEVPVLIEQSALFGVRRRLVGEFSDLGYKYTKVVKRKDDQLTSMGLADDANSRSYTLRRMTLGPEKELREREELLEAREQDLTIEALSKAEMAYVKFEVWTEARHGRWMIKGPAQDQGIVADELPQIADVWALPIDSKGVVRRNKCKSNVELSSTKTIVRCPDCLQDTSGILYRRCAACHNTRLVEMVYNVQCTIRLAQFTPLALPARLLLGNRQPHLYYIDTTDPRQVREILHDRAVDALQSAASRVVATHNVKHGSRLLMGRATVTRRGLLTVMVISSKTKARRVFDVQDGPDGTVNEVTEQVYPKTTKRVASPAPSSAFREGSFRHNNGSTTSLNSYDRGEDSIRSERGRTLLSPFSKRNEKEERVSSPLSSAAIQAPMIAPIPKRGWKAIFTR